MYACEMWVGLDANQFHITCVFGVIRVVEEHLLKTAIGLIDLLYFDYFRLHYRKKLFPNQ